VLIEQRERLVYILIIPMNGISALSDYFLAKKTRK